MRTVCKYEIAIKVPSDTTIGVVENIDYLMHLCMNSAEAQVKLVLSGLPLKPIEIAFTEKAVLEDS